MALYVDLCSCFLFLRYVVHYVSSPSIFLVIPIIGLLNTVPKLQTNVTTSGLTNCETEKPPSGLLMKPAFSRTLFTWFGSDTNTLLVASLTDLKVSLITSVGIVAQSLGYPTVLSQACISKVRMGPSLRASYHSH